MRQPLQRVLRPGRRKVAAPVGKLTASKGTVSAFPPERFVLRSVSVVIVRTQRSMFNWSKRLKQKFNASHPGKTTKAASVKSHTVKKSIVSASMLG